MARILSNCKMCRREGMKLFLKGPRCLSDKCAVSKRNYPPGAHSFRRGKITPYGIRLREKQKLKRTYGVLEQQFQLYFEKASKTKGNTGEKLMTLLEQRLDNVVLASGFAVSRMHARQLINHGHFLVNGKKVTIASYQIRRGDVITPSSKEKIVKIVRDAIETNRAMEVPSWLQIDRSTLESRVVELPKREDIQHPIQEQLIVELCAR